MCRLHASPSAARAFHPRKFKPDGNNSIFFFYADHISNQTRTTPIFALNSFPYAIPINSIRRLPLPVPPGTLQQFEYDFANIHGDDGDTRGVLHIMFVGVGKGVAAAWRHTLGRCVALCGVACGGWRVQSNPMGPWLM